MKVKRGAFAFIAAPAFLAVLLAAASCQPAPASPTLTSTVPTPVITPTLPPTQSWSPDGVLSEGEYLGVFTGGDYELRYVTDADFIYVGMKAETDGFVAVGFNPTVRMQDADIVLGYVEDGSVSIFDMYATGQTGPHPPDTELGGSDDIVEYGGSEEGGFTTIEFKRALSTGDSYDSELGPGTHEIIWSFSTADSATRQHVTRGSGSIEL